ncbi:MAG: hypothetical protein IPJ81_11690 [Chitinophagaceae bacterium]|nr:hypothetical protein [Chitinophagaceae bacterium]
MNSLKDSSGDNQKIYYTETSFKYKKTKENWFKFSKLKWVALIMGFWFLNYPKPSPIFFSILITFPIFTIFIYGFKNSSFMTWWRLREMGDGKYLYDFGSIFNFVTWIVALKVLMYFDFENKAVIYYPIGVIISMLILFCILPIERSWQNGGKKIWKPKFWLSLMLFFNIVLYFFTFTYGVNCFFDNTEPIIYKVKVFDKHITSGKGKAHYLDLTPWGNFTKVNKINVKKSLYNDTEAGTVIQVNYKKGLFNIPWYYIPGNNSFN